MADLNEELLALRSEHGRLTPDLVVNAARPADGPLHDRFTWDDSEAAERYRLDEARQLIRSVRVVYRRPNGDTARVRGWLSIDRPELGGQKSYEPAEQVLADPLTSKILLRQLERELAAMEAKYSHLSEFRQVVLDKLGLSQTA